MAYPGPEKADLSPPLDKNKDQDSVNETDIDNAQPDSDAQIGLQKVEATTIVWSKWSLIAAYAGIFFVFFINSLEQQTTGNLTAYVTSSFALHSLVPTTGVVSSIVGGVIKLPIARLIDIWGRLEGYVTMVVLCTIGRRLHPLGQSRC